MQVKRFADVALRLSLSGLGWTLRVSSSTLGLQYAPG